MSLIKEEKKENEFSIFWNEEFDDEIKNKIIENIKSSNLKNASSLNIQMTGDNNMALGDANEAVLFISSYISEDAELQLDISTDEKLGANERELVIKKVM